MLSSKPDLVELLSSITGIRSTYIEGFEDIQAASVAQRMSWESKRHTSREEDMAYSLFGIFDVNMPLLHEEGEKSFLRLQEKIIEQSEDYSFLAWGFQVPLVRASNGLFGTSPVNFTGCGDLMHKNQSCPSKMIQLTNRGLRVQLNFWQPFDSDTDYVILECSRPKGMLLSFPIDYASQLDDEVEIWRLPGGAPVCITMEHWVRSSGCTRTVFLKRAPPASFHEQKRSLGFEIRGIRK